MATRFVKASYQEVIDLHTESGHVTAIGVHTPTGDTPRKMFRGYFDQYRKYRYAGAKITFAPVAKLPADPLSVSYEAGEPTIDPRDLANPILVHGCHGDDMGTILNKLYGDNSSISDGLDGLDVANTDDVPSGIDSPYYSAMERLYYKALTDRTWKKAGIQRGFSKSGLRPLLYTLATNHQIMPTALLQDGGAHVNSAGQIVVNGGVPTSEYDDAESVEGGYELENPVDPTQIQFFTPHLTRLGWLDTRNVITVNGLGKTDKNISSGGANAIAGANELVQSGLVSQVNYVELPKLFMLCILLPPAYKTEMYFRAIITHYFQFKDFRGISFMPEQTGVPSYFNANDDLFDADTFDDIDAGDVPNDDSSGGDDSGGGSVGGAPLWLLNAQNTTTYEDGIPVTLNGVNLVLNVWNKLTYQVTGQTDVDYTISSVSGWSGTPQGFVYSIAQNDGYIGVLLKNTGTGSYDLLYRGSRWYGNTLSSLTKENGFNDSVTVITSPTNSDLSTKLCADVSLETDGVTVGWQVQ